MNTTIALLFDPFNSAVILTALSLLFWGVLGGLARRLGVGDSAFVTAPLSWLTAWAVLSVLPAVAHHLSLWLVA